MKSRIRSKLLAPIAIAEVTSFLREMAEARRRVAGMPIDDRPYDILTSEAYIKQCRIIFIEKLLRLPATQVDLT